MAVVKVGGVRVQVQLVGERLDGKSVRGVARQKQRQKQPVGVAVRRRTSEGVAATRGGQGVAGRRLDEAHDFGRGFEDAVARGFVHAHHSLASVVHGVVGVLFMYHVAQLVQSDVEHKSKRAQVEAAPATAARGEGTKQVVDLEVVEVFENR